MSTCLVPHTRRENFWMAVGVALGAFVARAYVLQNQALAPAAAPAATTTTATATEAKKSEEGSGKQEEKRCLPCEGITEALAPEAVQAKMPERPLWKLTEKGQLQRQFVAKNFQKAMDFLNAAAEVAEREGHHPDFALTSYRTVTVTLYTHSLNGVTENDFILAAELDGLPVTYSPKWARDNGLAPPKKAKKK